MRRAARVDLKEQMLPVVEGLGLEWVGLQVLKQGRAGVLLKLFVDKTGGLAMEDCVRLSRQLNGLLSVVWVDEPYSLEVSSPGLDRLLFNAAQCLPYIGRTLTLRLMAERGGKRHFKGSLHAVDGQVLSVCIAEKQIERFDFATISEARLVSESLGI